MREILRSKTIIGFIVVVLALTIYGSKKTEIIANLDTTENINSTYNI